MMILADLREKESEMELHMIPIEQSYEILRKYDVNVPREEMDEVDNIRKKWDSLIRESRKTFSRAQAVAPAFKIGLERDVEIFVEDVQKFKEDYVQNGPNQPGIRPRVAVERLKNFEVFFSISFAGFPFFCIISVWFVLLIFIFIVIVTKIIIINVIIFLVFEEK